METPYFLEAFVGLGGEDITWLQMSVRAVLIFLFGVVLVRLAGKRAFGSWSALDIILSIILGSSLSRALTGNAPFVQTLVAMTVLVLLYRLTAAGTARAPFLGTLVKGQAARLIRDGEVDRAALRRHRLGDHDLEEALRSSGVDDPAQVREAWIERGGQISVLKR